MSAAASRIGKFDDQVDQMTQVLNRLRGATSPAKKPVYQPPPPPSGDLVVGDGGRGHECQAFWHRIIGSRHPISSSVEPRRDEG
jgi:hypothetical protein